MYVLSWCPFYYLKIPKLARVGLYSRWGCIVSKPFLTGVVLHFEWGEDLFKSGVAFAWIRYVTFCHDPPFFLYFGLDSIISYSTFRFDVIIATHQPFGSFSHSACACARRLTRVGLKVKLLSCLILQKVLSRFIGSTTFQQERRNEVLFLLFA